MSRRCGCGCGCPRELLAADDLRTGICWPCWASARKNAGRCQRFALAGPPHLHLRRRGWGDTKITVGVTQDPAQIERWRQIYADISADALATLELEEECYCRAMAAVRCPACRAGAYPPRYGACEVCKGQEVVIEQTSWSYHEHNDMRADERV